MSVDRELARLRALEKALRDEYDEPGHVTKPEVRAVLDTPAPGEFDPSDFDPSDFG